MDVGEQLTKSRELQQSKESTSGHLVPVQPKLVPVQLAGKLAVDILYRYNLNLYRYNLNLYWYNCMELVGFVQELDPYARALSSTNQNGKITFEGDIKGRGHKQWAVFALLGLGF